MDDLVFLGVNDVGERIYEWLTERDDVEVLALLTERDQLSLIDRVQPDFLVSTGFRHIVPEEILEVPRRGAINLHKSYLPYNRGANPNVWSIVEDAPAGVSIHYMTPDVDAGPILDRRRVPVRPGDNGRDLYERLEDAQFEQFTEVWPEIRDDAVDTLEQDSEEGTYHYKQDFVELWELDLDDTVVVGEFLDRLRALTFPPYDNAYFERDGERYNVEVRITTADVDGASSAEEKNVPVYEESPD